MFSGIFSNSVITSNDIIAAISSGVTKDGISWVHASTNMWDSWSIEGVLILLILNRSNQRLLMIISSDGLDGDDDT